MNITHIKNQLLEVVIKYRFIIILLVLLGLFGYTLLRLQLISNPQPDPDYLRDKQQTFQTDKIQVKDSLRTQIEQLEATPVDVQADQVGRPDPFNP